MSTDVVPIDNESGVAVRQDFSGTEIMRGAETAMAAMAAQSKALVEARFVVAMRTRRVWPNIRINVNNLCKDPGFAAEALYVKPLTATPNDWANIDKRERLRRRLDGETKDWPMGFSIRFIEAALFECGNFDCTATVAWEDEEKRITVVSVLDLERNQGYSKTLMIAKVVERSYLKKGEEPITTRYNTNGNMVYVMQANPQQVEQSEAAAVSKAIRTLGEKLLPPHFKAEWRRIIEQTILDQAAKDPEAAKKLLLDNFAEKGVMPSSIEQYLEHSLAETQPAELVALRKIYVALANAEVTWRDVMEAKFGTGDDKPKESEGARKVKEALARKNAPAASPAPAAPTQPQQPVATATPTPAAAPAAQAVVQQQDGPPADLVNLPDWPETLEQEWYLIENVVYRFNDDTGNYAKWQPAAPPAPARKKPEPEAPTAAPVAEQKPTEQKPAGARQFTFPRRVQ